MFFSDDTIHKIYEDEGIFNFIYQLPQILYSTIIPSIIMLIVKELSLSQSYIIKIKQQLNIGTLSIDKTIKRCLKIKVILFYIIGFFLLIFFWYYMSCFCCVFVNSQTHLIKDTIISYGISMLYPFGLSLLPGFFRIPSLKKSDRETLYIISKIISFI